MGPMGLVLSVKDILKLKDYFNLIFTNHWLNSYENNLTINFCKFKDRECIRNTFNLTINVQLKIRY